MSVGSLPRPSLRTWRPLLDKHRLRNPAFTRRGFRSINCRLVDGRPHVHRTMIRLWQSATNDRIPRKSGSNIQKACHGKHHRNI
jgi:hypothetical protein